MLTFSLFILSIIPPPLQKNIHTLKQNEARKVKEFNKKEGKKRKRQVVHMNKSIKNDADIMLLISQHFNNVSVTESDTVFRVASKERTTQA